LNELQLIEALQQKEEAAFKLLVARYQDRVYHTALGFVLNPADAEDLAQEVFIRVFEKVGEFKGASSLTTWIYRVTVSQSLDMLRKKQRKKRGGILQGFFSPGEKEAFHPADFDHPGVKAENRERSRVLFQAMTLLPESQRTAFVLQKLEGLSQDEIAGIMKTSVSAVESLLSRAKANLKKQLTEYYSS
jgi:RNA polymerase sigma-70 factor (ECF subfamily)